MNNLLRISIKVFGIGLICVALALLSPLATPLEYLIAQMSTYTTLAQLPTTSPGGTFNLLTDSLSMAYNADSHGTRNWFVRPIAVTPIVTANWSHLGAGCTWASGTNYLNVVGTIGTTTNVCGWQRTVSAGDFAITLVFFAQVPNVVGANVQVGFTDGTKTEGAGPAANGSAAYTLGSAVKTTLLTGGTYTASNGIELSDFGPGSGPSVPLVYKLNRVATVLSVQMSMDGGLTFGYTIFSDVTPFLTASAIYIAVDPRTSSATAVAGTATLIGSTLQ